MGDWGMDRVRSASRGLCTLPLCTVAPLGPAAGHRADQSVEHQPPLRVRRPGLEGNGLPQTPHHRSTQLCATPTPWSGLAPTGPSASAILQRHEGRTEADPVTTSSLWGVPNGWRAVGRTEAGDRYPKGGGGGSLEGERGWGLYPEHWQKRLRTVGKAVVGQVLVVTNRLKGRQGMELTGTCRGSGGVQAQAWGAEGRVSHVRTRGLTPPSSGPHSVEAGAKGPEETVDTQHPL